MKSNNLELELNRFEASEWNDKITYEEHIYNGFSGIEGSECYNNYLNELYNNYLSNFRQKIDGLLHDKDVLLAVISDKISLFEGIKDDYLLKNTMYNHYDDYLQSLSRDMNTNNIKGLSNDYNTLLFFRAMSGTQMYYIEKNIDELKKMYTNYNTSTKKGNAPQPQHQESKHHIDEYFEKHFANKDITNKEIVLMFDISRPTISEWEKKGKLIKISDEGKRPIIYSKEKLIEFLKDGKIKDRLRDVQ